MGRLIDADLLMEAYLHDKKSGAVSMVKLIEEAPTAEKHGHWIMSEGAYARRDGTYCSECGWSWADNIAAIRLHPVLCVIETNFCPNCGAKMGGGEDDE